MIPGSLNTVTPVFLDTARIAQFGSNTQGINRRGRIQESGVWGRGYFFEDVGNISSLAHPGYKNTQNTLIWKIREFANFPSVLTISHFLKSFFHFSFYHIKGRGGSNGYSRGMIPLLRNNNLKYSPTKTLYTPLHIDIIVRQGCGSGWIYPDPDPTFKKNWTRIPPWNNRTLILIHPSKKKTGSVTL